MMQPCLIYLHLISLVAPRWEKIGPAALGAPYWAANSSLVTGEVGHSVHCPPATAAGCGVEQRTYFEGFDSMMSFGSAIVLEAGKEYSLRLVIKGAKAPEITAALSAHGASLWSASFGSPGASWKTVIANFTAPADSLNTTLTIQSAAGAGGGECPIVHAAKVWTAPQHDGPNHLGLWLIRLRRRRRRVVARLGLADPDRQDLAGVRHLFRHLLRVFPLPFPG